MLFDQLKYTDSRIECKSATYFFFFLIATVKPQWDRNISYFIHAGMSPGI